MIYSDISCRLTTSFSNFSFLIFSGENGEYCEGHAPFKDFEHQFQENILNHYLHCSLLQNMY